MANQGGKEIVMAKVAKFGFDSRLKSAPNPKEELPYRIQFNMSKEAVDTLENLCRETNSPSRANVIRKALGLLRWLLDTLKGGNKIYISKDGEKFIEVAFLDL